MCYVDIYTWEQCNHTLVGSVRHCYRVFGELRRIEQPYIPAQSINGGALPFHLPRSCHSPLFFTRQQPGACKNCERWRPCNEAHAMRHHWRFQRFNQGWYGEVLLCAPESASDSTVLDPTVEEDEKERSTSPFPSLAGDARTFEFVHESPHLDYVVLSLPPAFDSRYVPRFLEINQPSLPKSKKWNEGTAGTTLNMRKGSKAKKPAISTGQDAAIKTTSRARKGSTAAKTSSSGKGTSGRSIGKGKAKGRGKRKA